MESIVKMVDDVIMLILNRMPGGTQHCEIYFRIRKHYFESSWICLSQSNLVKAPEYLIDFTFI